MRPTEEELSFWKDKFLELEKRFKCLQIVQENESDVSNKRKLQIIELHAFMSMWKNRAEAAEKKIIEWDRGST